MIKLMLNLFMWLSIGFCVYAIDIKLADAAKIISHICYSFFGKFLYIRPLNLNLFKHD